MALPGCIVSPLVSAIGLPQNLAVRSRARSRHISYASVELVDGYRQLSVTVFHRLLHSNHCRTTVTLYRTLCPPVQNSYLGIVMIMVSS